MIIGFPITGSETTPLLAPCWLHATVYISLLIVCFIGFRTNNVLQVPGYFPNVSDTVPQGRLLEVVITSTYVVGLVFSWP